MQNQQLKSEEHLGRIEAQLVQHLGRLGESLEAPLARLIEVSSQAPQAAAEVIAELRQRINDSMARDNQLLQERAEILDQISKVSHTFGLQVQEQGRQMEGLASQLHQSALDVASLAQTFGGAVDVLHQTQNNTLAQLQDLQTALTQATQRGDEQLAYYIAQARELIELSLSAQQPLLEALESVVLKTSTQEAA